MAFQTFSCHIVFDKQACEWETKPLAVNNHRPHLSAWWMGGLVWAFKKPRGRHWLGAAPASGCGRKAYVENQKTPAMTLRHCFLTASFSPRMDDDLLLRQQTSRTAVHEERCLCEKISVRGQLFCTSWEFSGQVGPIGFTQTQRVYEIAAC